ncbi:MAG TPA: peptidase M14 [Candidatus Hydrogenedentes bacterium]|nr:peptidase M14 [Candidatus Hydrogenedentota bacterium]
MAQAHQHMTAETGGLLVDAAYPGGNILVESVEGDVVRLHPDLRDTTTWWFYWNFRVRGAAGRTLTFAFSGQNPIGVRGPAVSADSGKTWAWLGADTVKEGSFSYTFAPDAAERRFAFAYPYLEADLRRFLHEHKGHGRIETGELCTSARGRRVEWLQVGVRKADARHRVALFCRHHACETMANFVLEGVLEAAVGDTSHGRWLRRNAVMLAVPFMDKDGVEQGDQGKNRAPHDHNRDYIERSIYPEVQAIRAYAPTWAGGSLAVGLDLHCPWIRGGAGAPGDNEQVFFVGGPDHEAWARAQVLAAMLESVQRGPIVYSPRYDMPHGVGWNTGTGNCAQWLAGLAGGPAAATIEIPYANAGGTPVTPETARLFGHDLARALHRYLQEKNR